MRALLCEILQLPRVALRRSGGLTLLTSLLTGLSAWFIAALAGGPPLPRRLFLGLGLGASVLGIWWLRQQGQGWRDLLVFWRSWLGRGVFLVSAFLGLGALHLFFFPQARILAWIAASAGFVGLLALDRLQRAALKVGKRNLHAGQALLNGHFLLGLLGNLSVLIVGAGLLKAGLYWHRKQAHSSGPVPAELRLALGFLSPLLLVVWNPLLAAFAALLGDLVDRWEFYVDLKGFPEGDSKMERMKP